MPSFGVTPQKQLELKQRMQQSGILEADLQESFITSGGPGGQKVNRSATCVHLIHIPTGLDIKMQKARSQALNRYYARKRLCELIEAQHLGQQSPQALEQQRRRKQKARRARRRKAPGPE